MAKIRFENGKVVNFNGNPTQQDIEEVAKSFGTSQPKQPGLIQSIAQGIASPFTRVGTSLFNVGAAVGKYAKTGSPSQAISELTKPRDLGYLGQQKPLELQPGQGKARFLPSAKSAMDVAGEGINAGLTLATGGTESVEKAALYQAVKRGASPLVIKALTKGAGILPRALEQGVIGAGYSASSALTEGHLPSASELATGFGLGAAFPVVGTGASEAKQKVLTSVGNRGGRVIDSLIKPLLKDFSYGKQPGKTVAKYGIKANNFDDLVAKITTTRQAIGDKLNGVIAQISPQKRSNLTSAVSLIDKAMDDAASKNNQSLMNRLAEVKTALTNVLGRAPGDMGKDTIISKGARDLTNMNAQQVFDFKKLVGSMTKWTGNPSDDEAANRILKQVYGKAKEALDHMSGGKTSALSEDYASMLSAEVAAKYRDKILQRQAIINVKQHLGAIGAMLGTFIATGGASTPALVAAFAGAGLDKALGSTAVKTRLASWLAKATPEEKQTVLRAVPGLKNVIARIWGKKAPDLPVQDLPNIGLGIKSVGPKQIDNKTKDEMLKVIEYVRSGAYKKLSRRMEDDIDKLTQKFGIKANNYTRIADAFQKLVENTKTRDISGRIFKSIGR